MLFDGCIDDPVIPQGSISGTVYDEYTMQNPFTYVSIGEYPIIGMDRYGKFTIENVSMPYNLDISGSRGYCTKYLDLNISNVNVYERYDFGYARGCPIFVSFPPLEDKSKRVYIKFISEEINNQFDDISYYPETAKYLDVDIPLDKDLISGKLVLLEVTTSSSGRIISYDKFGYKQLTLRAGYYSEITFSENDISYNPPEQLLNFQVITHGNQQIEYNSPFISFPGACRNSEIRLYVPLYISNSGYYIMPVLTGLEYNYRLQCVYRNSNQTSGGYLFGEKWVYTNPGVTAVIELEKSPVLVEPADNQSNINGETIFSISDEEPQGVYLYSFYGRGRLSVYTDKKSLKLSELKSRNFTFSPNSVYYWGVQKFPNYNSINEFASVKSSNDMRYNSVPASTIYSFKTSP
jgi:hypothetical protein